MSKKGKNNQKQNSKNGIIDKNAVNKTKGKINNKINENKNLDTKSKISKLDKISNKQDLTRQLQKESAKEVKIKTKSKSSSIAKGKDLIQAKNSNKALQNKNQKDSGTKKNSKKIDLIKGIKNATKMQNLNSEQKGIISEFGDKIKLLVTLGKNQEFLTFDQINEHLDQDIDPKKIDRIIDVLSEFRIQIIEKEEDLEKILEEGSLVKDEEKSIKRSEDSVKSYLKSMSSVRLLTRDDEVQIAMRIEDGRAKIVKSLYQSPLIMRHFIEWYNGLLAGSLLLRDIIRIDETYNSDLEEMIKNSDNNDEFNDTATTDSLMIDGDIDNSEQGEENVIENEESIFEDDELEQIDETVTSSASMERALMPKMLEVFRNISVICQKIIDKSKDKTIDQISQNKEIIKLRNEFEKVAQEVSFADSLIKSLVEQLYLAQQQITNLEIELFKIANNYQIEKIDFINKIVDIDNGDDWLKTISSIKTSSWKKFFSENQ